MHKKRFSAPPALLDRIRTLYPSLSPAESRLADLVLNFPGELPGYQAVELAKMASTSNAAVTRFIKRIGFQSFEDMRKYARREQEAGTPSFLFNRSMQDPSDDLVSRHIHIVGQNLVKTFEGPTRALLERAADAIASAGRIVVVGFRHGHGLASYLSWSLKHARSNVTLYPANGETIGENLVDLGPGDVMLQFAMRRRVPMLRQLADQARRSGAQVILITDPGYADGIEGGIVLRAQTQTGGPIDDHAPAMVLAHVLLEMVINRLGSDAKLRFEKIDSIHRDLAEL